MTPAFIVDCSIAMTWLFRDEVTEKTDLLMQRLRIEAALVPALWFIEISNVVALAERKKRITAVDTANFISQLSILQLDVDSESSERAFDHLLPLCRNYQLTSYDAVYLELSIRRQLPLATLDEPLRQAAKKLGVKLLGK